MSEPDEEVQANDAEPGMERLQKVLASRGVASRRAAEDMIRDGRVRIDGEVVTEMGVKVHEDHPNIEVDGRRIPPRKRQRYLLLNKPSGYITTLSDERGRRTVAELIDIPERVVPVGRLDRQTEGLLLLTNDGELAFRVMHPRFEIDKEYDVLVDGFPPPEVLEQLRAGITIEGRRVIPAMLRPVQQTEDGTLLRISIHEGLNRVVRRIFDSVNYPVLKLRRVRVGPLQLGTIPRGAWRDLTDGELEQIREAVKMDEVGRPQDWQEVHERRDQRDRGERPRPSRGRPDRGRSGDDKRPGERRGPGRRTGERGGPPRREGDRRGGPGRRPSRPGDPRKRSGPGDRTGRRDDRSGGPRRDGSGGGPRRDDPRGPRRDNSGGPRRGGSGGSRERRQERD